MKESLSSQVFLLKLQKRLLVVSSKNTLTKPQKVTETWPRNDEIDLSYELLLNFLHKYNELLPDTLAVSQNMNNMLQFWPG